MEVSQDNRHQPHTLLLWLLGFYGKKDTSITPLSLVDFIFGTEIDGPASCYGY